MIDNDEQLAIVRDQIRLLEEALDSLEATVRPKSEKQFQLFAEGYIDQLQVLRDDITAYEVSLGSTKAGLFRPASDSTVKA